MKTCPHCGQPVRDEYKLCPFCGTDVATGKRAENEKTRKDARDAASAVGCVLTGAIYYICGACYLEAGNLLHAARPGHMQWGTVAQLSAQRNEYLWLGFGLPVLITGLPYLLLRRWFPAVARGLGFVCLVALAIALGAPFLCSR